MPGFATQHSAIEADAKIPAELADGTKGHFTPLQLNASATAATAADVVLAEAAKDAAELARDAAFVTIPVWTVVASGRASVADGAQFRAVVGTDIVVYQRVDASTETEIARYPTTAAVNDLSNRTATWNDAVNASYGLRLTVTDTASIAASRLAQLKIGSAEKFAVGKDGALKLYTASSAASPQSLIDLMGSHGETRFLHDFTYGNNGTVTPDGRNLFLGQDSGNKTMGSGSTAVAQASYNLGIGRDTLKALTTGYRNVAIGNISGQSITTGYENTAVGVQAMRVATTARNSVAIGYSALNALTTGINNVAIGSASGAAITTGADNVLAGSSAGAGLTTGGYNVAIGSGALRLCVTGTDNFALGSSALYAATGSFSIAIGSEALRFATSGDQNIAVGYRAAYNTTTGAHIVAIGTSAALANTTGGRLVALGNSALAANTTGTDNVAIGYQAGLANTTGLNSVLIGTGAGKSQTTPNNNIFIGTLTGEGVTTGAFNTAVGAYAMRSGTTGYSNTAIGFEALKVVGSGYENTHVGDQAGIFNRAGNRNVSLGAKAMDGNISGDYNTAIGFASGYVTREGDHNTYLGAWAGYGPAQPLANVSGSWSGGVVTLTFNALSQPLPEGTPLFVQIGSAGPLVATYDAPTGYQGIHYVKAGATTTSLTYDLASDPGAWVPAFVIPGTSNSNNTIVGANAMYGIRTGADNNTVFGYGAGYALRAGSGNVLMGYQAGDALTTGSQNIVIGHDIDADSATGSNQINIGGRYYHDRILLTERASDPSDPAEGAFALWMADGTESGDDGDIMVKITAGGVTKTATLVDYSAV